MLSHRLRLKLTLALWRHAVRPFAPRVAATKALYWLILGKRLNLENPQDYNEKLQWLMRYPGPSPSCASIVTTTMAVRCSAR